MATQTMREIDPVMFSEANEPHLRDCCRRRGMAIVETQRKLSGISRKIASAQAKAVTARLRISERVMDGEDVPEADRLHVLALEQEATETAELERRGPRILERLGREAREHVRQCAEKYFDGMDTSCETHYRQIAQRLAQLVADPAVRAAAQEIQALKSVALRWAGSAGHSNPGQGPELPHTGDGRWMMIPRGGELTGFDARALLTLVLTHSRLAEWIEASHGARA